MKRLMALPGMAVLLLAAIIVAGPALTWVAVHDRGWRALSVIGALTFALTLSAALAGLAERELTRRRTESEVAPTPSNLSAEQREQWRVLLRDDVNRTRVGDDGQLGKMIREGDPIDQMTTSVELQAGRPRVRVGGELLPWSEITRRWDAGVGRLVILGDPGYGKTVAALTLLKQINARSDPGAIVAELFPLSEWQRWRTEHETAPLGQWLAAQLARMHPELDASVARELVDLRLVLPVLDGLDEITAVGDRRACAAAIDAYAERGAPHRPFVVTCRAREYYELAPHWGRDDERVVLVGLLPDQIQERLAEPWIAGRSAWNALRGRQAAGDATINELFRSPLRLAIALQVYRDRDPGELLSLSAAQGHLWELLLANSADRYRDATPAQVRAWLAWLAVGMRRTGRQRFMLHELYRLDPESDRALRRFRICVGLALALIFGLFGGLTLGLGVALDVGVVFGLGTGLAGLLAGYAASPHPSVRRHLPPTTGMRGLVPLLGGALACGLVLGLAAAARYGVIAGLGIGVLAALAFAAYRSLNRLVGYLLAPEVIAADPPRRFAYARPDSLLIASRSSGLVVALVLGLYAGLWMGVVVGLVSRLAFGVAMGLATGIAVGFILGLGSGLDAWLYHHWLRRRLVAQGLLPARLPAFLEWCAAHERGWLRCTEAYEFRHRELLEHLAPVLPGHARNDDSRTSPTPDAPRPGGALLRRAEDHSHGEDECARKGDLRDGGPDAGAREPAPPDPRDG